MTHGKVVRHIQFKAGTKPKPDKPVSVSRTLADKPSGCVNWIAISRDLDLGPFYWFGAEPGGPLPSLAAYANPRRATHNKLGERPLRKNHHEIPTSAFQKLQSMEEVLTKLFGPL